MEVNKEVFKAQRLVTPPTNNERNRITI
jgi:hypothetical protein